MTRPLYEPAPDRTEASLSYGSQQLFRRPAAPNETDLNNRAWARLKTTQVQEIPDSVNTQVTFDADLAIEEIGSCADGIITDIPDGLALTPGYIYGIDIIGQWVEESYGTMFSGDTQISVQGGQLKTEEFALYDNTANSRIQRASGLWLTGSGTITSDPVSIYCYAYQASGSQQKLYTFFLTVVAIGVMCAESPPSS